jgi:hypothetical protein
VRKQRKAALMSTASEAFREALNAKGDRSLNEGAEKRRLENLVRTIVIHFSCLLVLFSCPIYIVAYPK